MCTQFVKNAVTACAAAFAALSLCAGAVSAEEYDGGFFVFDDEKMSLTITGAIPDSIFDYNDVFDKRQTQAQRMLNNSKGKIKTLTAAEGAAAPSNCGALFYGFSGLTSVDLSKLDTSSVTNMSNMFGECASLTAIDLSSFDTSKVTDMSEMFSGCTSLERAELTGFDTSKVKRSYRMFYECSSLKSLDLKSFTSDAAVSMNSMFDGCTSLVSLDISGLGTPDPGMMSYFFEDCISLESLTLPKGFTVKADMSLPNTAGWKGGSSEGSVSGDGEYAEFVSEGGEYLSLAAVMKYDLNGDGIVNRADLYAVAHHLMNRKAYKAAYDLNSDDKTDIKDVIIEKLNVM